eukprot:TRINITY_DN1229_c0_g2_i1.p1 TRINITY_DN1229_c0_g2~~TRINITY_DN1229_c0_g2_i1.p1  ORF type:complete len:1074 (+),score=427.26 TRINITY_DN1229_c0_g2_i1:50-3271(+)
MADAGMPTGLEAACLASPGLVAAGSSETPDTSPLAATVPGSTRRALHDAALTATEELCSKLTEPIQNWGLGGEDPEEPPRVTSGLDGEDPGGELQRLDDELSTIQRRLQQLVMELIRLRSKGCEVESFDKAVVGAIGCLQERHTRDTDSPISRKESTVSAVTAKAKSPGVLLGLCNPLLDMSLRVDSEFLERYGLEPDGWAVATPEMLEIFAMLDENPATQLIPGGSGLNTLRVAQWMLDTPGATTFLGATSPDLFGKRLHKATEAEGVSFPKIEITDQPTGVCAVLLTGESRSLVASLGASAIFEAAWLKERADLAALCRTAGLYYATGFFLRTSPESVQHLTRLATERHKEFALNMSAPQVCENGELFRAVLPRVDLLFGNAHEARALCKALGRKVTSDDETAYASALQSFEKVGRPRTVVITRGPENVVVAEHGGVASYDTARLLPEQVIDTNGAGDAFAGGFLARRLQGGNVAECVRTGQWAASVIIGQPGCTLPQNAQSMLGSPASGRRMSVTEAFRRSGSLSTVALSLPVSSDRRVSRAFSNSVNERSSRMGSAVNRRASDPSPGRCSRSGSMQIGTLLGLCNPLLDMSLHVDAAFLDRFGLNPNGWVAATDETLGIFASMGKDPATQYTPGGAGMNTLRVAQWILEAPGATTFIGTTGSDEFGQRLHAATEMEGVAFPKIMHDEQPTGTCAVLLTGDERSLVANLGASAFFEPAWLRDRPHLRGIVESAAAFYVTGFFLRTSPETVADLAVVAQTRDKDLCLNMSAPFVCEGSVHLFRDVLPKVDVLFGNAEEAFALAKALGADPGTDCSGVARRLQQIPRHGGLSRPRAVVITSGPGPVVVATEDGVVTYETARLPPDQVVDTNGAGDAFAGGFLAKRLKGGSVAECVRMGQWAATIIIGQPGCSLPPFPAGQMPGFSDPAPEPVGRDGSRELGREHTLMQGSTPGTEPAVSPVSTAAEEPDAASPVEIRRVVISVDPAATPKPDALPTSHRRPSMAGQALKLGHRLRAASRVKAGEPGFAPLLEGSPSPTHRRSSAPRVGVRTPQSRASDPESPGQQPEPLSPA